MLRYRIELLERSIAQIANGLATTTYAYDNNGNLTSGAGITNTWNYDNYLT